MTGTPDFQGAPARPLARIIDLVDVRLRRAEAGIPDDTRARLVWAALAAEMRRQRQAVCTPSMQRLAALSGLHPDAVAMGLQPLVVVNKPGVLRRRTTDDTGLTAYQLVDDAGRRGPR